MNTTLLYVQKIQRNRLSGTSLHSHDFWQLEIVTHGRIFADVQGEKIVLEEWDVLLIKPGTEHGFNYEVPGISWISFKFDTDEDICDFSKIIVRHSPCTRRMISYLEAIIQNTILKDYEKKMIAGHIEAIFCYIRSDEFLKPSDKISTIIEDIKCYIRSRNGKPVSVNELAEKFSYTRSHISKVFKKQTGHELKEHIDSVRLDKAKEMLCYSDFSIANVAFELGFADIYSFSRFFKKHAAVSPRYYRKNIEAGR